MDIKPGRGASAQRERLRAETRQAPPQDGLAVPLVQFFPTSAVDCPYVTGRAERKLIAELSGREAPVLYDTLSRAGFRRSHRFAYRPACRGCEACVPVRIAVARFAHSRSTRRIRNRNLDLQGRLVAARATPEQYHLFIDYQRSRHAGSDMAAMSYGEYRGMVEDTPVRTVIAEFRNPAERLVAAALIDTLDDGISAVYSFFDPAEVQRSLGTWGILWLVEQCRRQGLPYVYLGYWIEDSRKMAYKARFPALERLGAEGWRDFAPRPAAD
ncbi:MAG TPA: arginyltransferase [Stellaceae bacterium]|nr:arginyltransferase [Stellaceae bacterium]